MARGRKVPWWPQGAHLMWLLFVVRSCAKQSVSRSQAPTAGDFGLGLEQGDDADAFSAARVAMDQDGAPAAPGAAAAAAATATGQGPVKDDILNHEVQQSEVRLRSKAASHRVAAIAGGDGVLMQALHQDDKERRRLHNRDQAGRHRVFRAADSDHNELVDEAELSAYLRLRGVPASAASKLFLNLDQDGSGSLSVLELERHPKFGPPGDAAQMVITVDENQDGTMSQQEMQALVAKAREAFSSTSRSADETRAETMGVDEVQAQDYGEHGDYWLSDYEITEIG